MLTAAYLVIAQATPASLAVTVSRPLVGVRAVALAAAPTGRRFAAALENGTVRIIDAASRATVKTLNGHPGAVIQALAFSPDGNWLATGDNTARIFLFNTKTWQRQHEYRPHTRAIQSLSFSADSKSILSTGGDDMVFCFRFPNFRKEAFKVPGNGAIVYGATFYGTGEAFWAVASANQNARLYRTANSVTGLSAHDDRGMVNIAVNPASTRLATAGKDNRAALFDLRKPRRLGYFTGHEDWVIHLTFAPNGRFLATSSSDRTVRIWNPFNYRSVVVLSEQSTVGSPLAFTADGRYLVTVNLDENVTVHTLNPPQAPVARRR